MPGPGGLILPALTRLRSCARCKVVACHQRGWYLEIGCCNAALAIAVVGHKRVAEGLPVQHSQEATAIAGVVTAAATADSALQGEAWHYAAVCVDGRFAKRLVHACAQAVAAPTALWLVLFRASTPADADVCPCHGLTLPCTLP